MRWRPAEHVAFHVGAASELGGIDEEIGVEGSLSSLALIARVRPRDLADKLDVRLRRGVALGEADLGRVVGPSKHTSMSFDCMPNHSVLSFEINKT